MANNEIEKYAFSCLFITLSEKKGDLQKLRVKNFSQNIIVKTHNKKVILSLLLDLNPGLLKSR
jgi:hypothetical protein